MGNFVRDLHNSKEAVRCLIEYYIDSGYNTGELKGKSQQKKGDFWFSQSPSLDDRTNVEVKFDMYAARSGNLCFEMSNGKKLTGIMTTGADLVYYVVPDKDKKRVFVFETQKLRDFIQDSSSVTIKNGGDKKKFILALVKITDIEKLVVAREIFEIA